MISAGMMPGDGGVGKEFDLPSSPGLINRGCFAKSTPSPRAALKSRLLVSKEMGIGPKKPSQPAHAEEPLSRAGAFLQGAEAAAIAAAESAVSKTKTVASKTGN